MAVTVPMAYYNDNDPQVAQWLRNLIAAGLLPQGDVDERSITEVQASDLAGYTACHWFAGLGGWPLALQLAGWPASRAVWTGSCPCQPYSVAGRGKGDDDARNLWPHFRRLIATCLPDTILGEQVASSMGREWLSNVRFDLEHIYYWTAFYENLHSMRDAEAAGRVSPLFRQLTGRVEAVVQVVSERLREGVEVSAKRVPAQGAASASEHGRGSPMDLQRHGHSQLPGIALKESGDEEGASVRSGPTSPRVKGADVGSSVRNDRYAPRAFKGETGTQLPFFGSDHPREGVHLRQYQDRLLRNERGAWVLGGSGLAPGNGRMGDKEGPLNDESRITNEYGDCIKESVERLRLSGVRADLEVLGYAVGAADLCAAGVGAPHIRQRLYWVADSERGATKRQRLDLAGAARGAEGPAQERERIRADAGDGGKSSGLGFSSSPRWASPRTGPAQHRGSESEPGHPAGGLDHAGDGAGRARTTQQGGNGAHDGVPRAAGAWDGSIRIPCADGKWRRISPEPRDEPLAYGVPARMVKLRAYGNAIVPPLAAAFVRAYMEARLVNDAPMLEVALT